MPSSSINLIRRRRSDMLAVSSCRVAMKHDLLCDVRFGSETGHDWLAPANFPQLRRLPRRSALVARLEPGARRPAANVSWPEAFPAECDPSALSPRAKRLVGQYRSKGDMRGELTCAQKAAQLKRMPSTLRGATRNRLDCYLRCYLRQQTRILACSLSP